jgi:hypothetical protein
MEEKDPRRLKNLSCMEKETGVREAQKSMRRLRLRGELGSEQLLDYEQASATRLGAKLKLL